MPLYYEFICQNSGANKFNESSTKKSNDESRHNFSEVMEINWTGHNAFIVVTDTGELIKAYVFVAVLPYSCYAYFVIGSRMLTAAYVNAY
jgi:hypothetical protein